MNDQVELGLEETSVQGKSKTLSSSQGRLVKTLQLRHDLDDPLANVCNPSLSFNFGDQEEENLDIPNQVGVGVQSEEEKEKNKGNFCIFMTALQLQQRR